MIIIYQERAFSISWTIKNSDTGEVMDLSGKDVSISVRSLNFKKKVSYTYNDKTFKFKVEACSLPVGVYDVVASWNVDDHKHKHRVVNEKVFAITDVESESTMPTRYNDIHIDTEQKPESEILEEKCPFRATIKELGERISRVEETHKDDMDAVNVRINDLAGVVSSFGSTENVRGAWNSSITDYKAGEDMVYHYGCKWLCKVDNTREEPTWLSSDWQYLMGDCTFHIELDSSNGTAFRANNINTYIDARIYFGCFDVTQKVMTGSQATGVVWTRESSNIYSDNSWNPTVKDGTYGLCLRVNSYDVGENFVKDRKVTFTLTLKIPTSKGYSSVMKSFNFKL